MNLASRRNYNHGAESEEWSSLAVLPSFFKEKKAANWNICFFMLLLLFFLQKGSGAESVDMAKTRL